MTSQPCDPASEAVRRSAREYGVSRCGPVARGMMTSTDGEQAMGLFVKTNAELPSGLGSWTSATYRSCPPGCGMVRRQRS
jgi:hypothetical protein